MCIKFLVDSLDHSQRRRLSARLFRNTDTILTISAVLDRPGSKKWATHWVIELPRSKGEHCILSTVVQ